MNLKQGFSSRTTHVSAFAEYVNRGGRKEFLPTEILPGGKLALDLGGTPAIQYAQAGFEGMAVSIAPNRDIIIARLKENAKRFHVTC